MNTIKAFWDKVRVHLKTLVAFLGGIAVSVAINLINGSTPWPQSGNEWLQLAIASFGPAIATWIPRNKITQKQLDKDPNVIGGVVVSDAQIPSPPPRAVLPASGEYRNKYRR